MGERLWKGSATRAVLLLVLAVPLAQSVRLAFVMGRTDVRADAEELLYALPLGARVAIDRYGPQVPLSLEALERLLELRQARGSGLYSRERHRRRLLATFSETGGLEGLDEGIDAVPIEDLFLFEELTGAVDVHPGLERWGSEPAEVFAALGITHLVLVDRDLTRPNLLEGLVEGREPLQVFEPGKDIDEAYLPNEMDFALSALWTTDRPGPAHANLRPALARCFSDQDGYRLRTRLRRQRGLRGGALRGVEELADERRRDLESTLRARGRQATRRTGGQLDRPAGAAGPVLPSSEGTAASAHARRRAAVGGRARTPLRHRRGAS